MSDSFVQLAERVIDELLASDPTLAGLAGDHRCDDRLPDLSAGGVASRVAMLRDAAAALSGVDIDGLGLELRVDHELLLGLVERTRFALTELREHEWNPLVHNPGDLLYALVARPFAPAEQRLHSLAARLAAIPDALAVARAALGDSTRVHLETAADQFHGTAALVRSEVPALLEQAPAMASIVEPAVRVALAALAETTGWLRERAGGEPDGRDPRLGRRLYEAKLWHTLDTELTAAEVLRRAWQDLDRVGEQIREVAAELTGGPATDETVRSALGTVADRHPDSHSIVDLAVRAVAETTDFVRDHDLVSIVDDACRVLEMPEFARGVAVAYCESPGPLEEARVPTFYCIAPAPASWPPERVTSFYREYNFELVRNLTVHEAMPGHFLQGAHARRYSGATRTRAVAQSESFIEGWAVYAEQLMAEHGFGGLAVRLMQLKMQCRTTINAILDQLVHCADLTLAEAEAEAMALMTGRGFQEEGEAAGKWRRALLTSTQLSTYYVGYTEVSALGRARPADIASGRWHDTMLGFGSPSPRQLRTLLTARLPGQRSGQHGLTLSG